MPDKTIRVNKFNSAAEFRAWWENPATARARQANPGLLEGHPLVQPWLNAGANQEQFGKYRLLKKLGQGGMGAVWLAYDPVLKRQLALKTLMLDDTESTARFMREARATAKLKHPHIVNVYEAGVVGKTYYLTMDYIEGVSLLDLIKARDKSLTPKRLAGIICDMARALEYAHQNDIIHRDIKPANILIDQAGQAYLTDFGLAKELSGLDRSLTMSGTTLGTPDYMSPEQAAGRNNAVDRLSDIFSLGATLYHTLTGQVPFPGTELYEVLDKVINHDPLQPSSIIVVHKDLETICLKSMDKDKARRYQNMAELADDLKRYIDGEPIQARRLSAMTRVWRRVQKNKAVSVSTGLAILILLAVLVGWAINSSRTREKIANYRVEAEQLFGEKKYDQALIVCEKIRELAKDDARINDLRNKCLAEIEGRKAQLLAKDEQARRRNEAQLLLERAQRAPVSDQKIELAQKALKIDPAFAEVWQFLGTVYVDKFDDTRAMECFSQAIKLFPESAPAYYERAVIMSRSNMPEPALADYQMVLKLDPDSYMGYFARGCIEGAQQKYDAAIKSYTRAISLRQKYDIAYLNRGVIYALKRDFDRAIADFTRVIKFKPRDTSAYAGRAQAYESNGQPDLAVDDYDALIRIDKDDELAYYRRGSIYQKVGQLDKAINDYTQAIRLNPKKEMIYYYQRGRAYLDRGDFNLAVADFNEALRINPQYLSTYDFRGDAYYALENFDAAEADYTRMLLLSQKPSDIYNRRGCVYVKKSEPDKAIADFTQAVRIDPKNATGYYNRALVYSEKGMFSEAVSDAKMFLKLVPNHSSSGKARELLKEWESKLK